MASAGYKDSTSTDNTKVFYYVLLAEHFGENASVSDNNGWVLEQHPRFGITMFRVWKI